jgi:DNA-binding transcriptional ArsR family regulator
MVTSMDAPDQLGARIQAIADPSRRRILERLLARPGQTTAELCQHVPAVTRWAVMKHLRVLGRAGLVLTLPEGRRRRHYADRAALEPVEAWLRQLGDTQPR